MSGEIMSEKRFELAYEQGDWWAVRDGDITLWKEEVVNKMNEQQSTIERMQEENLYKNFELKSVDDLKKLKDIFEICMILIDGAIADGDLEMGYESVFQFERRIKKFDEGRIWERVRGYATDD